MGIIIDDDTPLDLIFDPIVDGEKMARGWEPRDYDINPIEDEGMRADPSGIKLIPRSDWDEIIKEQEERESTLEHVMRRGGFVPLNQKSDGYCWAYSTTGCVAALRHKANLPKIELSAHSVAAPIKNGRNEGGWCGLSAKYIREVGVATSQTWPLNSRNLSHNNAAYLADAARHKVQEDWYDLERPLHGQVLTFDQVVSLILQGHPVACDFNWWRHSVLCCRVRRIEAGSYGLRGPNSWGPNWNGDGWHDLRENKARPDGAVSLIVTRGSVR